MKLGTLNVRYKDGLHWEFLYTNVSSGLKKMDKYISDLITTLNNTFFKNSFGDENYDFNKGIKVLVDGFSAKKADGSKVFFIGNGGSAAIASHMTADFMKNGGINTYSLYDTAVTTCIGNDYGYDQVFARPLSFLASEGDLLVAISSSGKSQNIINAIKAARDKKADVYTFTGFDSDNPVRKLGDINVYVSCDRYGIVESIHNLILQEIVDIITERDGVQI